MPLSPLALALTRIRTTTRAPIPLPNSTLFRLDMAARSSRVTQAAADGCVQCRHGLVIVVCRFHGVALGTARIDRRVPQDADISLDDAVATRGQRSPISINTTR